MLAVEDQVTVGALVWAFINSPVGISLVGGLVIWILGKLFRARPSWEKIFHEHKGLLFDAIKWAEKQIPNDTENTAMQRADMALRFVLKAEASLAKKKTDVKKALVSAHAAVEKKVAEGFAKKKRSWEEELGKAHMDLKLEKAAAEKRAERGG